MAAVMDSGELNNTERQYFNVVTCSSEFLKTTKRLMAALRAVEGSFPHGVVILLDYSSLSAEAAREWGQIFARHFKGKVVVNDLQVRTAVAYYPGSSSVFGTVSFGILPLDFPRITNNVGFDFGKYGIYIGVTLLSRKQRQRKVSICWAPGLIWLEPTSGQRIPKHNLDSAMWRLETAINYYVYWADPKAGRCLPDDGLVFLLGVRSGQRSRGVWQEHYAVGKVGVRSGDWHGNLFHCSADVAYQVGLFHAAYQIWARGQDFIGPNVYRRIRGTEPPALPDQEQHTLPTMSAAPSSSSGPIDFQTSPDPQTSATGDLADVERTFGSDNSGSEDELPTPCLVCWTNPRNMAFLGCLHLVYGILYWLP